MNIRRPLLTVCLATLALIAPLVATGTSAAVAATGQAQLVSATNELPNPRGGDRPSIVPAVSADGRYVAFASTASNLDVRSLGGEQVYLRDTVSKSTIPISATATALGNNASTAPSISADGAYVAFISLATNLAPGANGRYQAYVWSRATGLVTLVSVLDGATPTAVASGVRAVKISGDGNVVAYLTETAVTGEPTNGMVQLFRRDLKTRTTTLVSRNLTATPLSGSSSPVGADFSLSADGGSISFVAKGQLTPTPTPDVTQIYVWETSTATMRIASANPSGTTGDKPSYASTISADGTVVAFLSSATNLVASPPAQAAYVADLTARSITIASTRSNSTVALGDVSSPALSADGKVLAFASRDISAVPAGRASFPAAVKQIYARTLSNGRNVAVSIDAAGTSAGGADSDTPAPNADGTVVAFASSASTLITDPLPAGISQIFIAPAAVRPSVERVGGADRFAVSASNSARSFAALGGIGPVTFIASGETFADALAASAAAGNQGGPVLLVKRDGLPDPVRTELSRLAPRRIIVAGGTSAVSDAVIEALKPYSATSVDRAAGTDRFSTSAMVSQAVFNTTSVAYVASGENYPDALSGSAAAGHDVAPVLLTQKNSLPEAVSAELKRLKVTKIIVLGGTGSVSDGVISSLNEIAPTTRLAGADRYEGSAAVSRATFTAGAETVFVASGEVYPDALSGSAAAIHFDGPMLLLTRDGIPASVKTELSRLKPSRIVVLGGESTVSKSVEDSLSAYLAR